MMRAEVCRLGIKVKRDSPISFLGCIKQQPGSDSKTDFWENRFRTFSAKIQVLSFSVTQIWGRKIILFNRWTIFGSVKPTYSSVTCNFLTTPIKFWNSLQRLFNRDQLCSRNSLMLLIMLMQNVLSLLLLSYFGAFIQMHTVCMHLNKSL